MHFNCSCKRRITGALCISLLLAASLALADDPTEKAPLPDAAAIAAAIKLVDEVHKDDIAAAKTPDQKAALSQALIEAAKEEKDKAGRFALLSKAKAIAVGAGDYPTAAAAVDRIDAAFSVDALRMKTDAATAATKTVRTPEQRKQLLAGANQLADEAVAADRYDVAKAAADIELTVSRVASDAALVKAAAIHVHQVQDTAAAFADAKKSLAVLVDKPNDPEANLKVGKFTCFIKGDWEDGFPMLALGSDATLKALAEKAVAGVNSADEQAKLGDGWWDVATKLTGTTKSTVQAEAGKWYRMAVPSLTGFAKARVESRLKSLAGSAEPPAYPVAAAANAFNAGSSIGAKHAGPEAP